VPNRLKKSRTSKFRTGGLPKGQLTTLSTSFDVVSDRYEGALDQINDWRGRNDLPPLAGADLKECEEEIKTAVRSVEYFKQVAPFVMTPKDYKRIVKADARKLREVALHGYGISGELLCLAAMLDNRTAVKPPRIRARGQAVDLAKKLLTRFGGRPPGLTKNGHWELLSQILFGVQDADVYEAMRGPRRQRRSRPRRV
jgi:hypothetical protein